MTLSDRMRMCREKQGYSQKEIAKMIGVKNNTLSSYESGTRRPDYETLEKLSEIYGVSIDFLITGKEKSEKDLTDRNIYFFDREGLTDEELKEIERFIEFVKWESEKRKKK